MQHDTDQETSRHPEPFDFGDPIVIEIPEPEVVEVGVALEPPRWPAGVLLPRHDNYQRAVFPQVVPGQARPPDTDRNRKAGDPESKSREIADATASSSPTEGALPETLQYWHRSDRVIPTALRALAVRAQDVLCRTETRVNALPTALLLSAALIVPVAVIGLVDARIDTLDLRQAAARYSTEVVRTAEDHFDVVTQLAAENLRAAGHRLDAATRSMQGGLRGLSPLALDLQSQVTPGGWDAVRTTGAEIVAMLTRIRQMQDGPERRKAGRDLVEHLDAHLLIVQALADGHPSLRPAVEDYRLASRYLTLALGVPVVTPYGNHLESYSGAFLVAQVALFARL